jgi:hypothetical protein
MWHRVCPTSARWWSYGGDIPAHVSRRLKILGRGLHRNHSLTGRCLDSHSEADARAAIAACKFPPLGRRSMWGQQPALGLRTMPFNKVIEVCDSVGSSVLLMIEAFDSIENIDSIASVEGVDALLVGCLDLSTDMGIPGKFESREFRTALETISAACQRHDKLMAIAGLYNNPEIQDWAINTLKVRFMVCQQDSNILAAGLKQCAVGVISVDRTVSIHSKVDGAGMVLPAIASGGEKIWTQMFGGSILEGELGLDKIPVKKDG